MTAQWYALYSKPLKESLLLEQLNLHQIESYYPCLRVQPVNPRARKVKPYFPRYIFGHLHWEQLTHSLLQWMPGMAGIVSFGGIPSQIPDNLIVAIRRRVEEIDPTGWNWAVTGGQRRKLPKSKSIRPPVDQSTIEEVHCRWKWYRLKLLLSRIIENLQVDERVERRGSDAIAPNEIRAMEFRDRTNRSPSA